MTAEGVCSLKYEGPDFTWQPINLPVALPSESLVSICPSIPKSGSGCSRNPHFMFFRTASLAAATPRFPLKSESLKCVMQRPLAARSNPNPTYFGYAGLRVAHFTFWLSALTLGLRAAVCAWHILDMVGSAPMQKLSRRISFRHTAIRLRHAELGIERNSHGITFLSHSSLASPFFVIQYRTGFEFHDPIRFNKPHLW